ncbi:hypothetical protein KSC_021670 [Ktedonobacter sp. SOSP1-52]|nr:hypothetical protein KSC_021670 [Ktedonobacter sp. SOSP1-52]
MEIKEVVAIVHRQAFLPVLRLLEEVTEREEATGMLVTSRWRRRNRRDSAYFQQHCVTGCYFS